MGTIIDLPASSSRPATDGGPIRILRPFPPEIVRDPAFVTVIAESPGGSYVAWGDDVGNLFVWPVGRNKLTALTDLRPGRTLDSSARGRITAIRFLDDEGGLCWMDYEGTLWEAHPGTKVTWTKRPVRSGHLTFAAAITAESLIVPRASGRSVLGLEEMLVECALKRRTHRTCRLYPLERGMTHSVTDMCLSRDDSFLGVLSECNAGVVELGEFKLVRAFDVRYCESIALSPGGAIAAVTTVSDELTVWRVKDGRLLQQLTPEGLGPVAFTTDRRLLFRARVDDYIGVQCLDVETGQCSVAIPRDVNASVMRFSPGHNNLWVGTRKGTLHVYDFGRPGQKDQPLPGT